jgi:hypothetical protein
MGRSLALLLATHVSSGWPISLAQDNLPIQLAPPTVAPLFPIIEQVFCGQSSGKRRTVTRNMTVVLSAFEGRGSLTCGRRRRSTEPRRAFPAAKVGHRPRAAGTRDFGPGLRRSRSDRS